jgi:hypothetical protein
VKAGDVEVGNAIRSLSMALRKSHSKLRSFAKKGFTDGLTSRLRNGFEISQVDRDLLADLLDGLLDNSGPTFDLDEVKRQIVGRVRAMKGKTAGQKPRVLMKTIYARVAKSWNSNPLAPRQVSARQVKLWYEKQAIK